MTSSTLIMVVGPTAVGKTKVCIRLAQHYQTEIVSTDSRQFYREMTIGTAKPNPDELAQVPHHLVNSLPITQAYDVKQFEQDALSLTEQLFRKYSFVVATGGSGLYVKTLCEGIDAMPDISEESRNFWQEQYQTKGLNFLLEELRRIDPIYYEQIDQQNHRRVLRALEVYRSSGKPFSEFRNQRKPLQPRPFQIIKIGLTMNRDTLYQRINQRVDQMIEAGLEAEAKTLLPYQHLNALRTVGYQEWFPYFAGQYDRDEAIRLIKRNSRRYAKRQWTWFNQDPEIKWFDSDLLSGQLLSSLIKHIDNQMINE
ncbi:tRNA (adenosine(37)-N6)-dimethylallyltransferase MiaA [Tunicatimonas pelagia]|uniref:tRNA (adenosine(37)-N6)-dimethylallyltransferase MiaA n=1 Tax=Tunicatimonas pelagia TaxID=931531 RepID=UPI002666B943|nr:tRNA (adenosine(37)-N6)-dimethylallyltransferase MiaA [Tunicatimonas pelagia]WKN43966.1 tRNA (adenosine(37)-N6)-dimethylallyltransferase MiaA [Tunicatimonas pelagia]